MDTQLYKVQTFNLRTLPAHPLCFGRLIRGAQFRANGSQSDLLGGVHPASLTSEPQPQNPRRVSLLRALAHGAAFLPSEKESVYRA